MTYPFELEHFNTATGQVTIKSEYFSKVIVDVPIENGTYLSGEPLMQYLQGFVPTWHVERLNAIKQGVDYSAVAAMCKGGIASEQAMPEPSYAELRAKAYPPVEIFIDGMVKADAEQMQAYVDRCLEVKAMYPKPEPVLVSDEVLASRREL